MISRVPRAGAPVGSSWRRVSHVSHRFDRQEGLDGADVVRPRYYGVMGTGPHAPSGKALGLASFLLPRLGKDGEKTGGGRPSIHANNALTVLDSRRFGELPAWAKRLRSYLDREKRGC